MRKHRQKGEGEASVLMMIFGAAIAISIGFYTIKYIASVKDARLHGRGGAVKDENRPPPRSMEEVGGYEITY